MAWLCGIFHPKAKCFAPIIALLYSGSVACPECDNRDRTKALIRNLWPEATDKLADMTTRLSLWWHRQDNVMAKVMSVCDNWPECSWFIMNDKTQHNLIMTEFTKTKHRLYYFWHPWRRCESNEYVSMTTRNIISLIVFVWFNYYGCISERLLLLLWRDWIRETFLVTIKS